MKTAQVMAARLRLGCKLDKRDIDEAAAMLRQQAEQIEALKADAERYRWLRALPIEAPQIGLDVVTWSNDDESTNSGVGIRLTELDAAIDAMKGKS